LLVDIIHPGDVLGLPWSRSVDMMSRLIHDLPAVDVVQLCGALEVAGSDSTAVDIVRRAAQATGGNASLFYAPLLIDDARVAATLRREPQVERVLHKEASRVTVAVMGIGAWRLGFSTLYDAAHPDERIDLARRGVIGETAGVCFDAEGNVIESSLSERVVTVSATVLRGMREVVAIAAGAERAPAVGAALAGGLVNSLVTDVALADDLLRTRSMEAAGTLPPGAFMTDRSGRRPRRPVVD
jgi:DNA-binding transcriptional regulator LsrR (DeoR family)